MTSYESELYIKAKKDFRRHLSPDDVISIGDSDQPEINQIMMNLPVKKDRAAAILLAGEWGEAWDTANPEKSSYIKKLDALNYGRELYNAQLDPEIVPEEFDQWEAEDRDVTDDPLYIEFVTERENAVVERMLHFLVNNGKARALSDFATFMVKRDISHGTDDNSGE